MSSDSERVSATATPSVADSVVTRSLPFVLSVIAGSTDVIGFLALDGLFTAHITGNLVILAARLVARAPAPVAELISVPVFIVALGLTRVLADRLDRIRIPSLWPLLLLQFLLLAGFLVVGATGGPRPDPSAPLMIFAGMLGVMAMAAQNALVRVSLTGAPSTAVMTTNVTVFTTDVAELLLARNAVAVAKARSRARHTWPAIAGFLLGCGLGAPCEAVFGLRSLVLPVSLALVAVVLGVVANLHAAERSPSTPKERSP